jgi:hemerythrin-like domain-containing protein
MTMRREDSRRSFLRLATGAGVLFSTGAGGGLAQDKGAEAKGETEEEEISPVEDLMREHGVLDRVLLIYDEALARLASRKELDPAVLTGSAGIVRRFIEDYHEKLEERELFPRFEKAHLLVDLVGVLKVQHQAGRDLTDRIRQLSTPATLKAAAERRKLGDALRWFIRMYRPHAAREDTVLFPAFRRVVSPNEYDALGEAFEKEEHRLFGEDGFEKVVAEVAALEGRLGIADLASFTPSKGGSR